MLNFFLFNAGISAETNNGLEYKSQEIGALGRIEPRSRVIKVSHNAGPEGARVAQLFYQEADQVKSGGKLAVLSDHLKKVAGVEAAKANVKVLEAQRIVE